MLSTARRPTWSTWSCATAALLLATAACGSSTAPSRIGAAASSSPAAAPRSAAAAPARVRYVWPLTGLPSATRPSGAALSIKVDNIAAARPQAGLGHADLVFECLVEGGLSRLMAVYQSQSAESIGPIRSARPVDGALLRALHGGIFAYSGAADGEIAPVKAYSTAILLSRDANPGPFTIRSGHRAPENVFASTGSLRRAAGTRGRATTPPTPLFTYGPAPAGSVPATQAHLVIGSAARADWTYEGSSYVRTQNGTPHLEESGVQLTAKNVVVLHVQVGHSGIRDAAGNEDPFVKAFGHGVAEVLRDGVLERGTWSRPTVASAFTFTTKVGRHLTLAPGPTWVELVPVSGSATFR
jgi:hypothetical protein